MEHEALEGLAALRNDEQASRRAAGNKGLLHGPPPGHEFLIVAEQVGWRDTWSIGVGWPPRRITPGSIATASGSVR